MPRKKNKGSIKKQNKSKSKKEEEKGHNILLLGSSHTASHIALRLLLNEHNVLTIADTKKDPNEVFLNPDMSRYQGVQNVFTIHTSQADFKRQIDFTKYTTVVNALNIHDSKYSVNNPGETFRVNIFVQDLLMEMVSQDYRGNIIHVSTDKVYGKVNEKDLPIKESQPCNPQGIRAISRYAQEMSVKGICESYGISYIILRFGTVFGDFTPLSKALNQWSLAMLMKQPLYIMGDGRSSRDWVAIYDASMSVVKALESKHWNETFNIGGMYPRERFLENIAASVRKTIRPLSPQAQMIFNAAPNDYIEENDLRIWMDSSKANKMIGYDPIKDFLNSMHRDGTWWLATYHLGWNDAQMWELERTIGVFSETRKLAAEKISPGVTGDPRYRAINYNQINDKGQPERVQTATEGMLQQQKDFQTQKEKEYKEEIKKDFKAIGGKHYKKGKHENLEDPEDDLNDTEHT